MPGLPLKPRYDVIIIGSGHNGLISAAYLAKAGLSVLVLERNEVPGGATQSRSTFPGMDARLSVYSYLISLFPEKIASDLGLNLKLRSRKTSSWTPDFQEGRYRDLLIRNDHDSANREAFENFTGGSNDYQGYCDLLSMQEEIASVIWPGLLHPLDSKANLERKVSAKVWEAMIEKPIGELIESRISDDLIRGLVFTDGRIGVSTSPHDESLLQNKCFLYHIIGQGTGEWRVPVGGMGSLVTQLIDMAQKTGNLTLLTRAEAKVIKPHLKTPTVHFDYDEREQEVEARFILSNAAGQVLDHLISGSSGSTNCDVEGAGFKINMLLRKLPRLRSSTCTADVSFAGTVHIDEGYEAMMDSHRESVSGEIPSRPPGEIYCHTLTDHSILSEDLNRKGYHTLTLFGLDMPYRLFETDNEGTRQEVVNRYLAGINRYLDEPIEECLAIDSEGNPCLEAMSAVDLEQKVHLPKGNIFHGNLTWPYAESNDEVGQWGVETPYPNIYICGSSAKRGGAVSGIPGHNAAMKVLEQIAT